MDNIINELLGIYSIEKDNDLPSQHKGQYMDISFEYYPMEPIKEDSDLLDSSLLTAELIDEKPSVKKPTYDEVELANRNLLKQFDIDLDIETIPIEMPSENVYFK